MKKKRVTRCLAVLLAIVMFVWGSPSLQVNALTNSGWNIKGSYGFAFAAQDIDVYDDLSFSAESWKGKIKAQEGFTIIDSKNSKFSNGYFYVDYSTPNGWKQGWISFNVKNQLPFYPSLGSTAATVNTATTLWYGNNADKYQPFGMVYEGESVAVLEYTTGEYWAFIEYNTNAGRKRGFVPVYYLTFCYEDAILKPLTAGWRKTIPTPVSGTFTVYSGPTKQYVPIGTVYKGESVIVLEEFTRFDRTVQHITYKVSGDLDKSGYIFLN